MTEVERIEGESEYHLIWRVYSYMKDTGNITQQEAGDICNKLLKLDYDESRHRKIYESFIKVWSEVKQEYVTEEALLSQFDEIDVRKDELYKQQVKTRDKLREYRSLLRDDARIENLIDTIKSCAKDMPVPNINIEKIEDIGNTTAILKISDWHIGKQFKNIVNEFDKNIAKIRVDKLIVDTIKYCKMANVGTLYISNLGDMIEGNLRVTARVSAEEDIIQQIMSASELVSYFLKTMHKTGIKIKYVSVLDNHSRANINFKEHIEKENFALLIDWYVKARLENDIEFISNKIDENIGYAEIDGKIHVFVHGHIKAHSVNSVIQNMVAIIGKKPDYVHCGHWHTANTNEFLFSKIFVNGSLTGVDDYAFSMGFFSKASQSLNILDSDNDIRIDINLN